MPNAEEQTRYLEALCQIESGINHNGQLYLPFSDLVEMIRGMPQIPYIQTEAYRDALQKISQLPSYTPSTQAALIASETLARFEA